LVFMMAQYLIRICVAFRKIELKARGKDFKVQVRQGYYAVPAKVQPIHRQNP
jgi:hypothetical protein